MEHAILTRSSVAERTWALSVAAVVPGGGVGTFMISTVPNRPALLGSNSVAWAQMIAEIVLRFQVGCNLGEGRSEFLSVSTVAMQSPFAACIP